MRKLVTSGFKGGLLEQAMTMTMGAAAIIAIFSPPIGIPLFILAYVACKKRYNAFVKKMEEE